MIPGPWQAGEQRIEVRGFYSGLGFEVGELVGHLEQLGSHPGRVEPETNLGTARVEELLEHRGLEPPGQPVVEVELRWLSLSVPDLA